MNIEPQDFNEYQKKRYEKIQALRDVGIEPYPLRSERTHSSQAAIAALREVGQEVKEGPEVTVAGRVVAFRKMGKISFLHIEDRDGRIQLYVRRDTIGRETYNNLFKKFVDLGDFIEVRGPMFYTRTKEATVNVQEWKMLAKAINQPPEKWHGLTDMAQRYRERYADLLSSEEVRRIFIMRSRITSLVRRYMESQGFIETETPILQPLYGGAAARPFLTHHNWAKQDLYLRIADELYLKRLIVGGLERVFEIGKDFRNEGISHKHNPEFTMLEAYQAYGDYNDMMELVQGCWSYVCQELHGTLVIPHGEHKIDLTPPWSKVSMQDAIMERTGIDIYEADSHETLQAAVREKGLAIAPQPTWGKLIDELFSEMVEPFLIQPTFITDYPREISPFAKRKPENANVVERFELFIGGVERANAFSELNDPMEQLARFKEQQEQFQAGDEEAHQIDEDYINALMYGMPPTGGIGWGMDRMVMLLANQSSIREVILFPQLRDDAQ